MKSAAILVLGDLNRSPRMLNHSVAISKTCQDINQVSLIGFNGGCLRSDVANDEKIKVYYVPERFSSLLKKLPRWLFILSALIKIILQLFSLLYILLFKIPRPEFLILQNPPGIPAMYICSVVCFIRRSKFIIDWHNYGYTILQVNRRNKLIIKLAYFYEYLYGKSSHLNFCVSEAMRKHLKATIGINAINLPDRAMANVFKKLSLEESHSIYNKYLGNNDNENEITCVKNGKIQFKENRPIMMLSSTSWTPDEDFYLLLRTFLNIEKNLNERFSRKVIFIITGKGPEKEKFLSEVQKSNLKIFDIRTLWLESDDYPKILGAVDLGVCLHYSSSGYDLPMKVVDMFSARLPVSAVYYPTIVELVEENKNGFLFKNERDLEDILLRIMSDFEKEGKSKILEKMSENLKEFSEKDWVGQWKEKVYPALYTQLKKKVE